MPRTVHTTVQYHNRTKVLLCYAIAWGLALALPWLGLTFLYPYKLAGTAPDLAATLAQLPFALPQPMQKTLVATAFSAGMQTDALQLALAARDLVWQYVVFAFTALAWVLSLLWQLLWRFRFVRPRQAARTALRAVRAYRWSMLGIWALNLLLALCVYLVGVSRIADRTMWDYLLYFGGFVLQPLAAMLCFRLAAPPALSGKHAFFRRL
ncbi:MAG: hypothetical protein LLF96_06005 [Eubacteriales bacterium]|nr:hypothetical protein [Eubacteriales bacterium]